MVFRSKGLIRSEVKCRWSPRFVSHCALLVCFSRDYLLVKFTSSRLSRWPRTRSIYLQRVSLSDILLSDVFDLEPAHIS